jgi:hypothetical protein
MDDEMWGVAAPGSPTDSLDGVGSRDGEASDDGDDTEGGNSMGGSSSSGSSGSRASGPARALIEEEEALEEARLAAEQIVMPLQQPVELLPRSDLVRKAQMAMCGRYQLGGEVVGTGTEARVRILPAGWQRPQKETEGGSNNKEDAAAADDRQQVDPPPPAAAAAAADQHEVMADVAANRQQS